MLDAKPMSTDKERMPVFDLPEPTDDQSVELSLTVSRGLAWGHALAMARYRIHDADQCIALAVEAGAVPLVTRSGNKLSDDALDIARSLAADLFTDPGHDEQLERVTALLAGAEAIGVEDDQARYELAYDAWTAKLEQVETLLSERRYLLGNELSFADLLLFAFAVRLDGVYNALFKANPYLLEDLPNLHGFARDLYEQPEVWSQTEWDAIVSEPHLAHTLLNAKGLLPLGGRPDLDAPHGRAELGIAAAQDASTEEDPNRRRGQGEWVRGLSHRRDWVGSSQYPAVAGRYHLFAPYNCPWSHRALLARSVKGLDKVVGATVVFFRRHPERGWQLNPAIPGCSEDPIHGRRFIVEYYEAEASKERSVPILYDTESERIVSNESAEILRMFDDAFGSLATRELRLYPEPLRAAIDRVNEHIYQRINNGAYKAGFANSQAAYERAYARYFAALRWVNDMLADNEFLLGTPQPTEADLRLFPTVFRHDAVYYARFRLNQARIRDYPALARWQTRMLAWPGVSEASNLDHARNGYFGRTGNEIVPKGPVPLGLSSKDYPRAVWLNEGK
jgi:putative glutathione S-transferase